MTREKKEIDTDQTDAVKWVANMLARQCSFHLKEDEFTEEEIQNMYYDHLLAEIEKRRIYHPFKLSIRELHLWNNS